LSVSIDASPAVRSIAQKIYDDYVASPSLRQ
jgi:hypothetical protein